MLMTVLSIQNIHIAVGGLATRNADKCHCMTGGDRRGFEEYLMRIGAYDIGNDQQNDWLQHEFRADPRSVP